MSSPGDFQQRRKNWTGGAMDASGVDEEFRSIRRSLGNNLSPLINLVTSLSADIDAILISPFVTMSSSATLADERVLTGTANQITVTDNGANSTAVLSIPDPFNSPGVVNVPNTKLQIATNQVLPILQIVSASTASATTTASTSYVSTNLTASITPKFNTSKIAIIVGGILSCSGVGIAYASLFRGATDLCGTSGGFGLTGNNNCGTPIVVYDSPATTSSTTYTVKIRDNSGATNAIFPSTDGGSFTSTATILLIEIAQ